MLRNVSIAMKLKLSTLILLLLNICGTVYAPPVHWRAASDAELKKLIPDLNTQNYLLILGSMSRKTIFG